MSIPLLAYADDLNTYLSFCELSLRQAIKILNSFYKLSGLEINLEKTCCTYIGGNYNEDIHKLCPDLPITWTSEFKLLGIFFDNEHDKVVANFDKKIKEIVNELKSWEYRLISPLGRLTVVKTLGYLSD